MNKTNQHSTNKLLQTIITTSIVLFPHLGYAQQEPTSNMHTQIAQPPTPPKNDISLRTSLGSFDVGQLVSGFSGIEGKLAKEVATSVPVLQIGFGYNRIIGHLEISELVLGGFFEFSHPNIMGGVNDDGKVEPIKGVSLPYDVTAKLEIYTAGLHVGWNIPIHIADFTFGPIFSFDPFYSKMQSAVLYGVEPKEEWLKSALTQMNINQNGTAQAQGTSFGARLGGGLEIGYNIFSLQALAQQQFSYNVGTLYQNNEKVDKYEFTDSSPVYSASLNLKF